MQLVLLRYCCGIKVSWALQVRWGTHAAGPSCSAPPSSRCGRPAGLLVGYAARLVPIDCLSQLLLWLQHPAPQKWLNAAVSPSAHGPRPQRQHACKASCSISTPASDAACKSCCSLIGSIPMHWACPHQYAIYLMTHCKPCHPRPQSGCSSAS